MYSIQVRACALGVVGFIIMNNEVVYQQMFIKQTCKETEDYLRFLVDLYGGALQTTNVFGGITC